MAPGNTAVWVLTLHSFSPDDWPRYDELEAAVFASAEASQSEREVRAAR